ncbi:hypothetical protein [Vulcanococcus sp. DEBay_Sum29NL08_54]|uniref:hypothetical protein n=2 Tax=unclassified Vulcanococcus TaxID=2766969 RepID=UPI0025F93D8B|nr:hypothetical protein [Vulcanococcus sp. DEBay_Sum29NL08_54]
MLLIWGWLPVPRQGDSCWLDPEAFLSIAPKWLGATELVLHHMQGFMFRIELLTPQGWSQTEEHEQRELAELQAMLKSQADGCTYRVTSPELSTLCVFTPQGSRCWQLDQPAVA